MRDSDQLVTFVDRSLGKKNIQAKNGRRTEYRVKDGRGNVMQKLVLHVHANDKRVWRAQDQSDRRYHAALQTATTQAVPER